MILKLFGQLASVIRRMSAQAVLAGGWLDLFRRAIKVLFKEGAGEFMKKATQFHTRVLRPQTIHTDKLKNLGYALVLSNPHM